MRMQPCRQEQVNGSAEGSTQWPEAGGAGSCGSGGGGDARGAPKGPGALAPRHKGEAW